LQYIIIYFFGKQLYFHKIIILSKATSEVARERNWFFSNYN